jgi:hypothetical protein
VAIGRSCNNLQRVTLTCNATSVGPAALDCCQRGCGISGSREVNRRMCFECCERALLSVGFRLELNDSSLCRVLRKLHSRLSGKVSRGSGCSTKSFAWASSGQRSTRGSWHAREWCRVPCRVSDGDFPFGGCFRDSGGRKDESSEQR